MHRVTFTFLPKLIEKNLHFGTNEALVVHILCLFLSLFENDKSNFKLITLLFLGSIIFNLMRFKYQTFSLIPGLIFDRRGSMSSCSHYSDSKVSSASQSPYHNARTLHSDSELTPKKHLNLNGDCNASNKPDHHMWSLLDIDDLPPKLQRLIATAFVNIEKKEEATDTVIQSPSHQSSSSMKTIAENDPKC